MKLTNHKAFKSLQNSKIRVTDEVTSEYLQKKLFSLGFTWMNGSTDVMCTNEPFIIIHDNKTFGFSSFESYFNSLQNKELNALDVINLEVTGGVVRAFNGSDECFKEMMKHAPFGWVKHKNTYTQITHFDNTKVYTVDEEEMWYEDALDKLEFADGGTFGIENKNE